MNITLEIAQEISNDAQVLSLLEKQLENIDVDIYNAAAEGKRSVKTALLRDDISFFEDVSDELEAYGFDDLHFLAIDIDGKKSAVLEIKW